MKAWDEKIFPKRQTLEVNLDKTSFGGKYHEQFPKEVLKQHNKTLDKFKVLTRIIFAGIGIARWFIL